ncbi:hypothetical protein AAF134_10790 [Synechococcus lacustris Tous-12m]
MNGKMGCIYRVGLLILMMAPSQLCCTENQSVEFIPGAPIIAPDEPGTGQLGQLFGLSADAPVRISGLWVGNSSSQFLEVLIVEVAAV